MVLTRRKIFLSPFFSRYAGILSILYLIVLRKWLFLELIMACLKRLMKLYAMIIKESHASVAQKSWEENLSAEKSYCVTRDCPLSHFWVFQFLIYFSSVLSRSSIEGSSDFSSSIILVVWYSATPNGWVMPRRAYSTFVREHRYMVIPCDLCKRHLHKLSIC